MLADCTQTQPCNNAVHKWQTARIEAMIAEVEEVDVTRTTDATSKQQHELDNKFSNKISR